MKFPKLVIKSAISQLRVLIVICVRYNKLIKPLVHNGDIKQVCNNAVLFLINCKT